MEDSAVNCNTLVIIAPRLAELTETVLFGNIWACRDLSPHERSLITLSTLTTLGRTQQLS